MDSGCGNIAIDSAVATYSLHFSTMTRMEYQKMRDQSADVVIVGSGPTGSAYARIIRRDWPQAKIIIVEAGPYTREDVGSHLDNIADLDARRAAEIQAQGPTRHSYDPITEAEWMERRAGRFDASLQRRHGLFLANEDDAKGENMFAGFSAANVGGMATKWSTGCPVPSSAELVSFIDPAEMTAALDLSSQLLGVNRDLRPDDTTAQTLRAKLGEQFNPDRTADRYVQPMPLACTPTREGLKWHGIDVILGDMLSEPTDTFKILAETACRKVLHENGVVTGVELAVPGTDDTWQVKAGTVIVAGDSLHSPQLLWASGIRPDALGRHLNDHYQITQLCEMQSEKPMLTMSWIPGVEGWPFSVTIAPTSAHTLPFPATFEGFPVFVGVFAASDVIAENRVTFDDSKTDWLGLPAISITAHKTAQDLDRLEQGKALALRIANVVGRPAPGFATTVLPVGSSLHYQGTIRMGETDDGASVCDKTSKVWGFENLYVAGNGVIPTMTATNPTLYSVALATIGARQVAAARRTA